MTSPMLATMLLLPAVDPSATALRSSGQRSGAPWCSTVVLTSGRSRNPIRARESRRAVPDARARVIRQVFGRDLHRLVGHSAGLVSDERRPASRWVCAGVV